MYLNLFFLFTLILLSGFFSSAETALFSISHTRARHYAKSRKRSDLLIKRMKEDPHNLLSTILIGNNVVNIGASAYAAAIAIKIFPHYAVGVVTLVMTFLILVFGEVLPKSVATRNSILIARMAIRPIYYLSITCYPIILVLNFIPRLTGKIKNEHTVSEEELLTFVEVVEEEGKIKEEEKELIHNIFEFDDTNASEIMTPRRDMFAIDINDPISLQAISESGYTRIPVFENDIDNIIGIINIKNIFVHQATSKDPIDVRELMIKPYFIPEHIKLDKLLRQFKKWKVHIAMVVDEHGGIMGLITLEDVLEEIVGEICDESDKEEPHIVRINKNEWRVLGKSDIDEVNATIPMWIPDSNDYDTLSGYILKLIDRIPKEKEEIKIGDFSITVAAMEGNRIQELLLKQLVSKSEPQVEQAS